MLDVSANNLTTKICMSSRNYTIAIPSALDVDVTFAGTGGKVNTSMGAVGIQWNVHNYGWNLCSVFQPTIQQPRFV